MVGKAVLVASLSMVITACHSQAHDHAPGHAEATPCDGADCQAAGERPSSGSGGSEPTDSSADISTTTDDAQASDAASPTACSELTQDACDASEHCGPITDLHGVHRGCGPREVGCKEVETCASNGQVTVLFPDSCIPEGYKVRSPAACETARQ
jgi:hypothetical protein